ncbi:DUF6624 domain-containing protein [Aquimarina celericrescens]|uniref:DUF6624 domain-containing protein n=1 Tax=Aquimarina celericrescens TaxID=1964542 RepID=A0ABW5AV76_9FLAO|nr:hypothetical protein [Aquimarina celericrescens]
MIYPRILQVLFPFSFFIAIITISCNDTGKNKIKTESKTSANNDTQEWVILLTEGYHNLNKNRSTKAADKIFEATELMPKKNWENYLVSATVYAPNGENEKAFTAIEKAIEAGFNDPELLKSLPEFSSLHNNPRWDSLISKTNDRRVASQQSIQNPELLEELKNMWAQDQLALSEYEENIRSLDSTASAEDYRQLFEPVENRWEINKSKLDSIVKIHGWPGYELVGEYGAKIAWAIPQHYPDVFYKEKCLSLLKKAIEKEDADPNHYAELSDRIARETWQKQIYGASMGETAPYPIKNPSEVNKRRLQLGLVEPIEVYAVYHGVDYQTPTEEEAQAIVKESYQKAQADYEKFESFVTLKMADSANVYITKAIEAYGDISNKQLYRASIELSKMKNNRSNRISLKILKVLIWRKWEKRYHILTESGLNTLHDKQEWIEIKELLEMSKS